jgi:dihydropteroate synthase
MRGLQCRDRRLELTVPVVMGVLNVTPDSFSDGGRYATTERALARARELARDGAAIIDVGGESTRPRAGAVALDVELERVIPVVEALVSELDLIVSVDTSEPAVMSAAAAAGAHLINDVRGLRRAGALEAVAAAGVGVCVMHMQGEPATMQDHPAYDDVVREVRGYLAARVADCRAAGIPADAIAVDPGFGFGKTLEHNLALLSRLGEFRDTGAALMVGLSRKSMIGNLTGRALDARLPGSVAAAALAVERGADIIRSHDVAPTLDAVRIGAALRAQEGSR